MLRVGLAALDHQVPREYAAEREPAQCEQRGGTSGCTRPSGGVLVKIGLGLPISDPAGLLSWARRADTGPFSTLGLLDRLVFDNPEPLVALAALAGATERIRVQTEVLLAPLRQTPLPAKQIATLARTSGSRRTLGIGIGIGGREYDFLAVRADIRRHGRVLDAQMARAAPAVGGRGVW